MDIPSAPVGCPLLCVSGLEGALCSLVPLLPIARSPLPDPLGKHQLRDLNAHPFLLVLILTRISCKEMFLFDYYYYLKETQYKMVKTRSIARLQWLYDLGK